jgi:PAS domain S-box-containing protein
MAEYEEEAIAQVDRGDLQAVLLEVRRDGEDQQELVKQAAAKGNVGLVLLIEDVAAEERLRPLVRKGRTLFLKQPLDPDRLLEGLEILFCSKRILIVDDNPRILETLSDILEEEDYQIDPVDGGMKAVEKIRSGEYPVALVDIKLPDISGLEVLKHLRKVSPETIVVMISGHGTIEHAIQALKEGAHDYITKPLDLNEVKAGLEKAFEYHHLAERKRKLEQENKEARDYLQQILMSSADMIMTTNLEARIVEINRAGEEMLGYKREELIGRPVEELYPDYEERRTLLERVKKEGSVRNYETRLRKKDGEAIDISLTLSLLQDGNGEVIGTVGVSKDIRERKKAEEEERKLRQQLSQSEKLAEIGKTVVDIVHEISNPLNAVMSMAEAIRDETDPQTVREHAREIVKYIDMASAIMLNLTSYSRSARIGEYTGVDVHQELKDALKMSQHNIEYEAVETVWRYELGEGPHLKANSSEIRQIFTNIMNNAVQAMEGKGRLTLSTRRISGFVEIRIEDTGPGIPQEIRPYIFDHYFTTKEAGKGSGIGLSIVKLLVTRYQGYIEVESEQGKGTAFIVRFPAEGNHAGEGPPR